MKPFIPRRLAISHHAAWQVIHVRLLKRDLRQVLYTHGFSPDMYIYIYYAIFCAHSHWEPWDCREGDKLIKISLFRIGMMIRFPTVIATGFGQPRSFIIMAKNGAGNVSKKKVLVENTEQIWEQIRGDNLFPRWLFFLKIRNKICKFGCKRCHEKKRSKVSNLVNSDGSPIPGNFVGDLFGMVKTWPFQWFSDLQPLNKRVTLNHLVYVVLEILLEGRSDS